MVDRNEDIDFRQLPAEQLGLGEWVALANLNERAVVAAYKDDMPELLRNRDLLRAVGVPNAREYGSHLTYPDASLSHRNKDQLVTDPWVTVAMQGEDVVAWAYTVQNTSGPKAQERMDARLPLHRWLKIGWVATAPEVQRRGLATDCIRRAIERSGWLQPISAYAYPGDRAHKALVANGLRPVEDPVVLPTAFSASDPLPTRRYVSAESTKDLLWAVLTVKSRAKLPRL